MNKYIPRKIAASITEASAYYQIIVVTGPRQVGKTTLCRNLFPDFKYYNLEELGIREIADADPKAFIDNVGNQVIIDEVQHLPKLLSEIQVRVDTNPNLKVVLTGSSNFALLQNVTQSLAGRAALFTLLPFAFDELDDYPADTATDKLMTNGFYPPIFDKKIPPQMFYANYYSTYVERDVRQLVKLKNLESFQRFIRLCAGRIGTEVNMASLGVEVGVAAPTIREWISILQASYIIFPLKPYFTNINKRLTKTPKLYFYDVGLVCHLLGIENSEQLMTHPLRGAVFENMAVAEMLKQRFNSARPDNLYFYRENSGREVDVVQEFGAKIRLFEVKSGKTFQRDYIKNLEYLKQLMGDRIESATVVYDGESVPPLAMNVRQL